MTMKTIWSKAVLSISSTHLAPSLLANNLQMKIKWKMTASSKCMRLLSHRRTSSASLRGLSRYSVALKRCQWTKTKSSHMNQPITSNHFSSKRTRASSKAHPVWISLVDRSLAIISSNRMSANNKVSLAVVSSLIAPLVNKICTLLNQLNNSNRISRTTLSSNHQA